MRIFIGIELSDDIKKRILTVQKMIRDSSEKGRWKYVNNLHLTLKFIGEISQNQLKCINDNMILNIDRLKHFEVQTDSIGFFRGNGSLRVVYLKIDDQYNNLNKLFELIEDICYLSGVEKEKRSYTPHITIAQDVVLNKDFLILKSRAASSGNITIPVNSVSIIRSEQIGGKRVYTALYKFDLK